MDPVIIAVVGGSLGVTLPQEWLQPLSAEQSQAEYSRPERPRPTRDELAVGRIAQYMTVYTRHAPPVADMLTQGIQADALPPVAEVSLQYVALPPGKEFYCTLWGTTGGVSAEQLLECAPHTRDAQCDEEMNLIGEFPRSQYPRALKEWPHIIVQMGIGDVLPRRTPVPVIKAPCDWSDPQRAAHYVHRAVCEVVAREFPADMPHSPLITEALAVAEQVVVSRLHPHRWEGRPYDHRE